MKILTKLLAVFFANSYVIYRYYRTKFSFIASFISHLVVLAIYLMVQSIIMALYIEIESQENIKRYNDTVNGYRQ